jgi:hypothetical protein
MRRFPHRQRRHARGAGGAWSRALASIILFVAAAIVPLHAFSYAGGPFCRHRERAAGRAPISHQQRTHLAGLRHGHLSTEAILRRVLPDESVVCLAKRRAAASGDNDMDALDEKLRKEIGDEKYDLLVEAAAQV